MLCLMMLLLLIVLWQTFVKEADDRDDDEYSQEAADRPAMVQCRSKASTSAQLRENVRV